MNRQIKIKVIKKNAPQVRKMPVIAEEIMNRRAAREMASVVSSRVNESGKHRRAETRQAINLLDATSAHNQQIRQFAV